MQLILEVLIITVSADVLAPDSEEENRLLILCNKIMTSVAQVMEWVIVARETAVMIYLWWSNKHYGISLSKC